MANKSDSITAAELMARLEKDPEYQLLRTRKDADVAALEAACAEDEKLLVRELRSLGYDVDSVWDLVFNEPHEVLERKFAGPYVRAYPLLASHLREPHHPRIRDGIIRALTVPECGADVEDLLLDQFCTETDFYLRWVIANAIETVVPPDRQKDVADLQSVLEKGCQEDGA